MSTAQLFGANVLISWDHPIRVDKSLQIPSRKTLCGFTLVELLVVIGIIALLISILLPALNKAREMSKRTACAAKLQQIMVAANIHRADHMDYYPITGILAGGQPSELDDRDGRKYDYRNNTGQDYSAPAFVTNLIAPITVALGTEMGFKQNLYFTHAQTVVGTTDASNLYRSFMCPSHVADSKEFSIVEPTVATYIVNCPSTGPNGAWIYSDLGTPTSYIFNECVLGFNDSYGRLRGHASSVRQPARTMFAIDGLVNNGPSDQGRIHEVVSSNFSWGTLSVYNNFPNPYVPTAPVNAITLGNVYGTTPTYGGISYGGTASSFDTRRHKGKINIACCDGHVELRSITAADMQYFYLVPPH